MSEQKHQPDAYVIEGQAGAYHAGGFENMDAEHVEDQIEGIKKLFSEDNEPITESELEFPEPKDHETKQDAEERELNLMRKASNRATSGPAKPTKLHKYFFYYTPQ